MTHSICAVHHRHYSVQLISDQRLFSCISCVKAQEIEAVHCSPKTRAALGNKLVLCLKPLIVNSGIKAHLDLFLTDFPHRHKQMSQ